MKKILIFAILSSVIITIGYFWLYNKADEKSETPQWSISQVKDGPIRVAVSCTGQVVSNLDVEIKCKASGEVVKLPFDISDQVKKGDLLVELNPVDERRKVKQAKISLASAQARLMQSIVNLQVAKKGFAIERRSAEAALKSAEAYEKDVRAKAERMKQLLEKKLTSQEEKGTAETASIQAEVDLENAQIRMEQLALKDQEL